MERMIKTIIEAAKCMQIQHKRYARPWRDFSNEPRLFVWSVPFRSQVVGMDEPDYEVKLSTTGLSWVCNGTYLCDTSISGVAMADLISARMSRELSEEVNVNE